LDTGNKTELTDVQKMILGWIVGLTSAGRKDALSRYYFPSKLYDAICKELESMGFVKINKAGSVQSTNEGKNYYSSNRLSYNGFESVWYNCYNWKTRKFEGIAREILQDYNAKYNLYSK
jgi:hypothetical protein